MRGTSFIVLLILPVLASAADQEPPAEPPFVASPALEQLMRKLNLPEEVIAKHVAERRDGGPASK